MRAARRIAPALAAGCLALVGLIVAPAQARAQASTRCSADLGQVEVTGDLVVPAQSTCVLTGTTVDGNVRVAREANLIASDGHFQGAMVVGVGAYADLDATTVDQAVALRGAFGLLAGSSTFGGDVVTSSPGPDGGFVELSGSTVAGSLRSDAGELDLEQTQVHGNLVAARAYSTHLRGTSVDGNVQVVANRQPSLFCGGTVGGNAVFANNAADVRLGVASSPLGCDAGTHWGGNVVIVGTRGQTLLDHNLIEANLVLQHNDPTAVLGPDNVVRGRIVGEYQDSGDPA